MKKQKNLKLDSQSETANSRRSSDCVLNPDANADRNPHSQYLLDFSFPVNTNHFYNICAMLDQRRRRWANIVQIL